VPPSLPLAGASPSPLLTRSPLLPVPSMHPPLWSPADGESRPPAACPIFEHRRWTAPLLDPSPLQGRRPLPLSSPSSGRGLQVAVIVGSGSTSLASSSSIGAGFEQRASNRCRPGLQVVAPCRCWRQIWANRYQPHLRSPPSCWAPDLDLVPPDPVRTCSSSEGGGSSHSLCASQPTLDASAVVDLW
jgi:hypothetical protein